MSRVRACYAFLIDRMPIFILRQLEEALRVATQQIAIPVVIEYVDVVLDSIAYYKPHVDPKLSGYGYRYECEIYLFFVCYFSLM